MDITLGFSKSIMDALSGVAESIGSIAPDILQRQLLFLIWQYKFEIIVGWICLAIAIVIGLFFIINSKLEWYDCDDHIGISATLVTIAIVCLIAGVIVVVDGYVGAKNIEINGIYAAAKSLIGK
jgi:hypothetical protein